MRDFKTIRVWEKAHHLTLQVYKATAEFPKDEMYGLTSQTRRAAASIPANIAEGCGRDSEAELRRFLTIARGSASELEYHLLLAHDLGLLAAPEYTRLLENLTQIEKMLTTFLHKVKVTP